MSYVELQVTSNFTFLRGGSHPEELIEHALSLGYKSLAITDRNTLAGIVRAHSAATGKDIRLIPACRLDLLDGPSLLAYPTDKDAYSRLSGLLTLGNMRAEKGKCFLYKRDVYEYANGIKFIAIPPDRLNTRFEFDPSFKVALAEYRKALGDELYLGASRSYQGDDGKILFRLSQLSEALNVPLVAINDVHYHCRSRRELQDILTCTREKCTIFNAGFRLYQNAERYLKPQEEMQRLFLRYPEAIKNTQIIADACRFTLDSLEYVYPEEITSGRDPQSELELRTWQGATERYGDTIPEKIINGLKEELAFIARKNYAAYFLTVYDIVNFARSQNILCQGRGSAANSVVCFCLGVTGVDPTKFKLLFSRFMSDARDEPPDIDVDFEHERREEVMQYIYSKYGRHRAGIVATVTHVHWKRAIRDVGKAMGLSEDTITRLSKSGNELTPEWLDGNVASSEGFDPRDAHLRKVLELTHQYIGFPRQLGQHTGGFVITQGLLSDLCPVIHARMADRTNIEWNKDDIERLKFLKIDVLALGMLTCIRKSFELLKQHYGIEHDLSSVPQDDAVYGMISAADTIGVFQIESRAQMSMLPRLRPKNFYDLVIQVAIVRPGPIQGDMVHPYLRRRNGQEAVEYPSKELEEILGRTLGVPLFQEQAMEIAIVAAGFTPAEADGLRRSMATFKAHGQVTAWREKLVKGMVANGYNEEFSLRVFKQLEGFGSYGFPESHAASFALLVYISCWLKHYYPDVFAAALLNSQPMGFYQPAQIVTDARKHGVEVRPVDVNFSGWDNILEERSGNYFAMRLGMRQVNGLRQADMEVLIAGRNTTYTRITELRDAGGTLAALETLANADAFRSLGLDSRSALWEVAALQDRPNGMYQGQTTDSSDEKGIVLPEMSLAEQVVQDYSSTALSLKAHPVSFLRPKLGQLQVGTLKGLDDIAAGQPVRVCGMVLVRQRPGTAKGVCFVTLEDETTFANLVVWQTVFDKYRKEILQSRLLMVEGVLQREGKVTHVVVNRCYNFNKLLGEITVHTPETPDPLKNGAPSSGSKPIQPELFPGGRDFK